MAFALGWRAAAAAWWASPEWEAYERASGDEPGTRSRLLATAAWKTRIVDLAVREAVLWAGVRKSYRPLITRARGRVVSVVYGVSIAVAQGLHYRAAARVTRPQATWDLMRDWLRHGRHGVLLVAEDRATHAGLAYAYFIVNGPWAYYASGASVEENLQHAVIWNALLALKTRGVCWAELGWQGEAQDAKGKSVEFFKTGFGGHDEPAGLTEAEWRRPLGSSLLIERGAERGADR